MRVALVPHFNVEYTVGLANALANHAEVAVFAREDLLSPYRRFFAPKVECREAPISRLMATATTTRAIRDYDPSIVHIQNAYTWLIPCLPLLESYPTILTIHDPKPHWGLEQPHSWPIVALTLAFSDRVIVHGQRLREQLLERYRLAPDKVRVLPLGELVPFTGSSKMPEEGNTVLFFGRIYPYKGLDQLLRAVPHILAEAPDSRFIIAGAGDLSRFPELRDDPHFEVHNRHIPLEDVADFFGRAAVVVLPYVEASQSAVLVLAYQHGKPVVATRTGGIPELVDHGVTGILVPPRDSNALTRAIVDLLSNPEKRRQMGAAARRKIDQELNWDGIAEQTLAIYREIG